MLIWQIGEKFHVGPFEGPYVTESHRSWHPELTDKNLHPSDDEVASFILGLIHLKRRGMGRQKFLSPPPPHEFNFLSAPSPGIYFSRHPPAPEFKYRHWMFSKRMHFHFCKKSSPSFLSVQLSQMDDGPDVRHFIHTLMCVKLIQGSQHFPGIKFHDFSMIFQAVGNPVIKLAEN